LFLQAEHINLPFTELLQKVDEEIGKAAAEVEKKVIGAEGRLAQAENRHAELMTRREKRRQALQQRALTLQSVERITSVLVLPHPERSRPEVRRLEPDPEVEAVAMQIVMEQEKSRGCQVYDVHEKNLGYDITSLDLNSGELRLIEVKGIGAATATCCPRPTNAASLKTAGLITGCMLSQAATRKHLSRSLSKARRASLGMR
jgi:hypothetical protein